MKRFINQFFNFISIILITNLTFAQTPKENKSAIEGVILEGGLINLKEAKSILGFQFKNLKSFHQLFYLI